MESTPRKKKITPEIDAYLTNLIEENADTTLQEMKSKILEEFKVNVSLATISRRLTRMDFVLKDARPLPISRNCDETIALRKNWVEELQNNRPIDRRNIIYIDETGYNLHIRRRRGRAKRGKNNLPWIEVPNSRGANISVAAAMNETGLLHSQAILGPFNSASFCSFLLTLFQKLQNLVGQIWIVMDNCQFHKTRDVRFVVEGGDNPTGRRLVFLPLILPS